MNVTLSPLEIENVQNSWEQCIPIADDAAELFYGKLFELDPDLRPMFKTDLKAQGKKLMQMITYAVKSLNSLETIVNDVQVLGARHRGYGVQDQHYDTVATALLWTLEQGLGEAFDPPLRLAWTKVYIILSDAMKSGANAEVAAG